MNTSCGVGIWLAALVLGLALLLGPQSARACGGFFGEVNATSTVVAMSDIRVLLVRQRGLGDLGNTPDRLHQYVQIAYQGDAGRFAWVYPVSANPEVTEATSSPFAALEESTAPRITIHSVSSGSGGGGSGCGCLGGDDDGSALRGGGDEAVPPTVKVWQSGQVGAFDYVVLSATASQTLVDWLHNNGFAVPTSATPVLDHYLSMAWLFVAMKVSVQKVTGQVPSTTVVRLSHPIAADAPITYPLRMVSLSPDKELTLEIFVASAGGVTPRAPFATVQVPATKLKALSARTHNYDTVFGETARSGPRVLVLEYASSSIDGAIARVPDRVPGNPVLSRFRAVLTPSAMDQDLLFDRGGTESFMPSYRLEFGGSPDARPAGLPGPLAGLALVWLAWRTLRRRRDHSPGHRS